MSKKFSLATALTVGILMSSTSFVLASTPCGCSVPSVDECSSCHQPKASCDCGIPKTEEASNPSDCTSCQNAPCGDRNYHQQQVYAYPNAIYGGNQVIGESKAGITVGNAYQQAQCACDDKNEGKITGAAVQAAQPSCECNLEKLNMDIIHNDDKMSMGVPINIQTKTSREVIKKSLVPFEVDKITGAAVPMAFNSPYEDLSQKFWAACDIDKLTSQSIVVGYPDNTFRPNRPITRAEFATMAVKGLNIPEADCGCCSFSDVPQCYWAQNTISQAVSADLMKGYPGNKFKPNVHITRAEALTILSKAIKCEMSCDKANSVLGSYTDGSSVPVWSKESVAKALEAGALSDSPNPNRIMPNKTATRADVASMLENIRVSIGLSKECTAACDTMKEPAKTYMEKQDIITIPTLKLSFLDEVSAKSADVGNQFAAKTLDDVMINGVNFPAGSLVRGKVQEVIRPSKNCEGGLKLSFNTIQCGDMKADLPQQILSAQVNCPKKPNGFVRTIEWPFTWVGGLVGNIGRSVGGAVVSASNAVENVTNGFGVGSAELLTGQFRAAGRSYQDMTKNIVKAPVDATRTALSGTLGLFQYTGDEVAYLVDPKGMKVSSINPKADVTISFACLNNK